MQQKKRVKNETTRYMGGVVLTGSFAGGVGNDIYRMKDTHMWLSFFAGISSRKVSTTEKERKGCIHFGVLNAPGEDARLFPRFP